jgi:hypothetical protein
MLKRLEPDLDSMRQLITCKICQRFLSEPYGLACGHTYCYVCLDAWLVAQRKRTCPDCRGTIKTQPVPSFLIREMTRVFAYRAELLPDGETVEEHDEYIKEAVAKVSIDKESGGLFSGLFKHGERMQWMPLHDPGDDVDRCPNCHWELEEGVCASCGLNVGDEDGYGLDTGESESSLSGDDDDDGLDNDMPHDYEGLDDPGSYDEDDFMNEEGHSEVDLDIFGPLPIPAAALRRRREHINLDSEPESEDSEDPENDPQMEGFIDHEGTEDSGDDSSRVQSDSESEAEETPRHSRPRQIIRHVVIDDSDDEIPQQPRRHVNDLTESDDEPLVLPPRAAGKVSRGTRRPHVVQISSSGEDTSDDDEEEEEEEEPGNGLDIISSDSDDNSHSDVDSESDGGVRNAGNFSPMHANSNDESQADDLENNFADHVAYYSGEEGDSNSEANSTGFPGLPGEGSDDDDGGRSTTAGSAPFHSFLPSNTHY